jgi:hypothetical protein
MNEDNSTKAALEHILWALEIVAHRVVDPEHYAEVATEEFSLGQIRDRAELIIRLIKSGQPSRLERRQ